MSEFLKASGRVIEGKLSYTSCFYGGIFRPEIVVITQEEVLPIPVEHASTCGYGACTSFKCKEVKKLFSHSLLCTTESNNCTNCRRTWLLIYMHAKCCNIEVCPVPRCTEMRKKWGYV